MWPKGKHIGSWGAPGWKQSAQYSKYYAEFALVYLLKENWNIEKNGWLKAKIARGRYLQHKSYSIFIKTRHKLYKTIVKEKHVYIYILVNYNIVKLLI